MTNGILLAAYNQYIGAGIELLVLGLLVTVATCDLVYALMDRGHHLSQTIAEYFESWSQQHPVSAALLAALLGAMVSHFFWSTGHPGPSILPWR